MRVSAGVYSELVELHNGTRAITEQQNKSECGQDSNKRPITSKIRKLWKEDSTSMLAYR